MISYHVSLLIGSLEIDCKIVQFIVELLFGAMLSLILLEKEKENDIYIIVVALTTP